MENKNTLEPIISEKEMYTGKYISLKVLTIEKQKGYTQREIVNHDGTISVIGITENDTILIYKIYRKTVDDYSYEIPSKKIETNDNHIDIIKDDIFAKVGYEVVDNLKAIYNYYPSISYSNEKVYLYLANIKKVKEIEDSEIFSLLEIKKEDIDKYIQEEKIIDSKTLIGLNYIKNNINL